MQGLHCIAQLIKTSDLFSSIEFLRFNKKSKIATIEGGLVSITILALLSMSLLSVLSQTLQRSNISCVQTITNDKNAAYTQISIGQKGNFMFGIRVTDTSLRLIDLNTDVKYFDILLLSSTFVSGQMGNITLFQLEKCTAQHWAGFPSIAKDFQALHMNKWLCPSINSTFGLSGSIITQFSQSLVLSVLPCSNNSYSERLCHSQQEINQAFQIKGGFLLNFFFTNPIFNLQNQHYIDYKLSISAIFPISQSIGGFGALDISEFVINTDTSIWPFQTIQTVSGLVLDGVVNYRSIQYTPEEYFRMYLFKSSASYTYDREVQKLGTIFSYIGGLLGIFYSLLAFMGLYTDRFYKMTMIKKMFNIKIDTQMGHFCDSFNIFKSIKLKILQLISLVKPCIWIQRLSEFQQELEMQLDIGLFVKRIIKLQKLMTSLISERQIADCFPKDAQITASVYKQLRQKLGNLDETQQKEKEGQISITNSKCFSDAIQPPQMQSIEKRMSIQLNKRFYEVEEVGNQVMTEITQRGNCLKVNQRVIKKSKFVKEVDKEAAQEEKRQTGIFMVSQRPFNCPSTSLQSQKYISDSNNHKMLVINETEVFVPCAFIEK